MDDRNLAYAQALMGWQLGLTRRLRVILLGDHDGPAGLGVPLVAIAFVDLAVLAQAGGALGKNSVARMG